MAQSEKSVTDNDIDTQLPGLLERFREKTELETLSKQLLKLLPHLTCYRCKSIPRVEFPSRRLYQCGNAHLLCNGYHGCGTRKKCLCGEYVSKNVCSLASSLVDTLPFCCENKGNGCEEILFQEEMKAHFSRCMFEKVTCINDDCSKRMPFEVFLDHIALPTCSTVPKIKNRVEVRLTDSHRNGTAFISPKLMEENPLNESVFYSVGLVMDNIMFAWICYLGFKEDAERYTYSLEVNKDPKHSVKFTCPVKSIFESPGIFISERDAFMMSLKIGTKLCKEQGHLYFDFEIFDDKEEVKDDDNDSAISEKEKDDDDFAISEKEEAKDNDNDSAISEKEKAKDVNDNDDSAISKKEKAKDDDIDSAISEKAKDDENDSAISEKEKAKDVDDNSTISGKEKAENDDDNAISEKEKAKDDDDDSAMSDEK